MFKTIELLNFRLCTIAYHQQLSAHINIGPRNVSATKLKAKNSS